MFLNGSFFDINPRSGRFKSADSNGWAPNGEVPRSSHFVVKTSDRGKPERPFYD